MRGKRGGQAPGSETEPRHVLTVSELVQGAKGILEGTFAFVWVGGEVSNLRRPRSGHAYFTLKDSSSQIRAVLFRGAARLVRFALEDGMEILAGGRVTVYPAAGDLQVIVERCEPRGIGALQLAFEQLKEKLRKEGLFDESRKRPLPVFPRRVGIVTSATGAAVRDILHQIEARLPRTHVVLCPVKVQGEGAAEEIARAIATLNESRAADVVVCGRGGGSLEDLWAFNEEVVARAIARSEIPIVSAVGHESDWTIADLVADARAPTPTKGGEMVVPRADELGVELATLAHRLDLALGHRVGELRRRLEELSSRRVLRRPQEVFELAAERLDRASQALAREARGGLERCGERLRAAAGRLESVSPLAVLARGYSITRHEPGGAAVRSIHELAAGQRILTILPDGTARSRVEEPRDTGRGRRARAARRQGVGPTLWDRAGGAEGKGEE